MAATMKCEICNREVDKRGYANHLKTHEQQEKQDIPQEEQEGQEPDPKNRNIPLSQTLTALMVGMIGLALMLIFKKPPSPGAAPQPATYPREIRTL